MFGSEVICSRYQMGSDTKSPIDDMKRWPVADWTWSKTHHSPDVTLSRTGLTSYFQTSPLLEVKNVAGVRGCRGLRDGEHYWEVKFIQPPCGSSVMVGICTEKALLHSDDAIRQANLIGVDRHGWGLSYKGFLWHNGQKTHFCAPFYEQNTVIGFHLNLYEGTLTIYKNRQRLGVAVEGLHLLNEQIFPAASSTSVDTELEISHRSCRHLSLQEQCFVNIARRVKRKTDVDHLPLPHLMKRHLVSMT